MMVSRKGLIIVLLLLLFLESRASYGFIGVGITYGKDFRMSGEFSSFSPYTLRVPVYITRGFRVEPEFGYYYMRKRIYLSDSSEYLRSSEEDYFRVGLGIQPLVNLEDVSIYPGVEMEIQLPVEDSEGEGILPLMYGTLLIGSEYYFIEKLSIGGEAGICIEKYGDDTYLYTRGALTMRWYFLEKD